MARLGQWWFVIILVITDEVGEVGGDGVLRKIVKIGNSEGVTIPARVMRGHKLQVGDKIDVRFTTKIGNTADQEVIEAALQILKRYKKDFTGLAKR